MGVEDDDDKGPPPSAPISSGVLGGVICFRAASTAGQVYGAGCVDGVAMDGLSEEIPCIGESCKETTIETTILRLVP